MENLEKVELLRTKANVSYEDAKSALEACNYDTLDALIYLEKLGKVGASNVATYSTANNQQSAEFVNAQQNYERSVHQKSFGDVMNSIFEGIGKLIKKGCETTFQVTRYGERKIAVPVIVLVICLIFAFWITIPLMVVGLFLDCKYRFVGFNSTKIDINDVCDKAADVAGNIKNDFKSNENNNINQN